MKGAGVSAESDAGGESAAGYRPRGKERMLLWVLAWIVRIWQSSLQWRLGPEDRARLALLAEGGVLVLWHNRLFPGTGILAQLGEAYRGRFCGLVSASRDGGRLAYLMERLAIQPIRGSSSRRGRAAMVELMRAIAAGKIACITVDGPRGPCYSVQAGAAYLAVKTTRPVLLVNFEVEGYWRLRSWDRFIVPHPFSTVWVRTALLEMEAGAEHEKIRSRMEADLLKKTQLR